MSLLPLMTLDCVLNVLRCISACTGKGSGQIKKMHFRSILEETSGEVLKMFDEATHRDLNLSSSTMEKVVKKQKKKNMSISEFILLNESLCSIQGAEAVKRKINTLEQLFGSVSEINWPLLQRYYIQKGFTIGFSEKNIFKILVEDRGPENQGVSSRELLRTLKSYDAYALYNLYINLKEGYQSADLCDTMFAPMLADTKPLEQMEVQFQTLDNWSFENKLDGIRLLLKKRNGQLSFWTRSRRLLDPLNVLGVLSQNVKKAILAVPGDIILDGELWIPHCAPGQGFRILSPIVKSKRPPKIDAIYSPFDILYTEDHKTLYNQSYDKRKQVLYNLNIPDVLKSFSLENFQDLRTILKTTIYEGLVMKKRDSLYCFKRSLEWLKIKPNLQTLDVQIVRAHKGKGKYSGYYTSVDVAVQHNGQLVQVGQVGSGFSENDLIYLKTLVENDMQKVIIQIKCEALLRNKKNSNYALRFPRFINYREDKTQPLELHQIEKIFGFPSRL